MKKSVIGLLSVIVLSTTIGVASAKVTTSPAVASGIKLYKAGNYSQSYLTFSDIVKKDPSNALAYYYLGMSSAQIGKRDEAIDNYEKVLTLAPYGQLNKYAAKGKLCIENPEGCHAEEEAVDTQEAKEDRFIRSKVKPGWSEQVRNQYETQKIQNMMREMNRSDEITPQSFKDYKDFSSQGPTNEEIVSAIRVLQSAGLGDIIGNSPSVNEYGMLNALMNNKGNNVNPMFIQSLLTSQMSANF